MIYVLIKSLFSIRKYDLIYAVTFRGLELVILLRALGLFRKPIVIWHHSAVIIPKNRLRRLASALFYKGIDKMFFFSEELRERSIRTAKVKPENAIVVSWGADLSYYNEMFLGKKNVNGFISTGAENRDFFTLLKAFDSKMVLNSCSLYIRAREEKNLSAYFELKNLSSNINLHFGDWSLDECAHFVNDSYAVVIACLDYPYTVGLTTLVEALALGKAIITTDNPTFPIDVEKEGIGIKVPYGDVNAWIDAINYFSAHPDIVAQMGRKARLLAEKQYNLELCSESIATVLLSIG